MSGGWKACASTRIPRTGKVPTTPPTAGVCECCRSKCSLTDTDTDTKTSRHQDAEANTEIQRHRTTHPKILSQAHAHERGEGLERCSVHQRDYRWKRWKASHVRYLTRESKRMVDLGGQVKERQRGRRMRR
eukprot:3724190-Rhodomonas_salina.2